MPFRNSVFTEGKTEAHRNWGSPRDIVVQQQIKYMHLARTWWSCLLYILCCGLSRGKPQSQNLCIFQWRGCFSREFSYQCNTSLKWKLFMQAELDLVIKNCHSNRKFLMRESWEEIWFIYGKTCCGYILKWLIFTVTIQCTSQPDLSCFFFGQ